MFSKPKVKPAEHLKELLDLIYGVDDEDKKQKRLKISNTLDDLTKKVKSIEDNLKMRYKYFLDGLKEWERKFKKYQRNKYQKSLDKLEDKIIISSKDLRRLIDRKIEEVRIIQTEDIYTTKTRIQQDKTVSGTFKFIGNISGVGVINQILIQSPSTDYTIFIKIDENLLWEQPYSYFQTHSEYLENASAFLDGGSYYLSIRTLFFLKRFEISITATPDDIIFDQILCKYQIRDEKPV